MLDSKTIRPLGNRVLLRPLPLPKQSHGGILLPETPPDLQREFVIEAVGSGDKVRDLPVGTRVFCNTYAGREVGGERRIVDHDSLIAIMEA